MTFPFMALVACGVISAASNVLVREIKQLIDETKAGKLTEARALHRTLIHKMRLLNGFYVQQRYVYRFT